MLHMPRYWSILPSGLTRTAECSLFVPKPLEARSYSASANVWNTRMVFTIATLGFAKHLRARGVPASEAEAHAEAARDVIMAKLVAKTDLEAALDRVTLRMTVRFGVMLVAGVGALAAVLKLA